MLVPTAVERVSPGAHAVAASTTMRSTAATAAHDGASAAMRSTASAFGRRTQRRTAQGNHRSGQTNRYFAHHDAHSINAEHPSLSESNSAVSDELQQCGIVARVRLRNRSPNETLDERQMNRQ